MLEEMNQMSINSSWTASAEQYAPTFHPWPLRQRIIMNYNIDGYSKKEGRVYIEWKLKKAVCCLWYTKFTEKKRQNSLKKAREFP